LLPYSITLSVPAEATLAVPSAKWTGDAARWDAAFAACLQLNGEIATGDIPLTRPAFRLAGNQYLHSQLRSEMAERDAAIDMLAGLLG
jgi:hypothetical protein